MFPLRPNTCLTSRELINEYASLDIRNTVSMLGESRVFISAICNSYS